MKKKVIFLDHNETPLEISVTDHKEFISLTIKDQDFFLKEEDVITLTEELEYLQDSLKKQTI